MRIVSLTIATTLALVLTACAAAEPPKKAETKLEWPRSAIARIDATSTLCNVYEHGSSFFISKTRLVTNAHVVAGAEQITVDSAVGVLEAMVVYFDPLHDVAILKVPEQQIRPLEFGGPLLDGEEVTVNGFPFGKTFVQRNTTKNRSVDWQGTDIFGAKAHIQEIYELLVEIDPGDSGGPVLDAENKVRGIVLGKAGDSKAYAIPVSLISDVINATQPKRNINTRCVS
jgi:S1-C subfamily serine protease